MKPSDLDERKKAVYDSVRDVADADFHFGFMRNGGELIGPWNQGGPTADPTYRAGEAAFGRDGMAEVIYLVGTFHLIAAILNGYDVPVPGREEGVG